MFKESDQVSNLSNGECDIPVYRNSPDLSNLSNSSNAELGTQNTERGMSVLNHQSFNPFLPFKSF